MRTTDLTSAEITLIIILAIWELGWKGFAMWRAAQNNDKVWYVAMFIINTVGILPIIYLLLHPRRRIPE